MKISLSPLRSARAIEIFRDGDVLTIDGVRVDFSTLEKGETRDGEDMGSPWILGDVTRDTQGVLHLMLALPHGAHADDLTRYPDVLDNPADGRLDIPHYQEE